MLKSIIYALAAMVCVFAQEDGNKVEVACKPCCPERCPEPTALIAAEILVNNFCTASSFQNIAIIQEMINDKSAFKSTGDTYIQGCVVGETVPFLNGLLQGFQGKQCVAPTILSSYIDNKGRVIVLANMLYGIGEGQYTFQITFTFEPVQKSCEFILVNLVETWDFCLAPARK